MPASAAASTCHRHDDRDLLVTYWTEISGNKDRAYNHGHQALRWIVIALLKRGHTVSSADRNPL